MVFDPEKHEEDRKKFLAALREMAGERMQETAQNDPALQCFYEADIGARAALTRPESDRIGTELIQDGLVDAMSGDERGPMLSLTREGCSIAETYLFERSPTGKRRKVKKLAKEKINKLTEAGLGKFAAWIGVYFAGVFSGVSVREIVRFIGRALGLN